jgi:hypothetical protein
VRYYSSLKPWLAISSSPKPPLTSSPLDRSNHYLFCFTEPGSSQHSSCHCFVIVYTWVLMEIRWRARATSHSPLGPHFAWF